MGVTTNFLASIGVQRSVARVSVVVRFGIIAYVLCYCAPLVLVEEVGCVDSLPTVAWIKDIVVAEGVRSCVATFQGHAVCVDVKSGYTQE